MSQVQYDSFRANNDKDLTACLNTMVKHSPNFTVISINQVHGYWVVFYTRLVSPEASAQALLDTLHERQPPDRSWVETVPYKDAHKEAKRDVEFTDGPKPRWQWWKD